MKKLHFLLLFTTTISWSQNKAIDSLVAVMGKTKNDIDRCTILNAISDEYKYSDPKLMIQYANSALELSKKINHQVAQGNALLNLGNANIILGDYTKSINYFIDAQQLFETISNKNIDVKKGLAKAYGSIGIVFSEQSNYAKALSFHLKSVKIYEQINDKEKCAKLYNNIGVAYKSQQNYFKALEYFVKAQKLQEQSKNNALSITYTNIATIYVKQKNFVKADEYFKKAKKLFEIFPNERALGEWYNNMGTFYKEQNQYDNAIASWQQAVSVFTNIDDKFGVADTYLLISELQLQQNKPNDAIVNANKALVLANKTQVLEQKVLAEKVLSDSYAKQNNTTLALQHFKAYSVAKDSLVNEEIIRKSVEEELNFDYEKRAALQQKELEKKDVLLKEQHKRNTLQLIFAGLFGLLLFGIAFLIYNRMQLKKNLTLQKELAQYEQKALHLQMNPHFVFNCLGSISSFIVQNGTDTAVKYLSKFSKLMRLTLEYSKENLIPIDREIESLQNYLELEQLRFNNKFSFSISKSNDIEDDMALPPLLLQPFVENAIIHGVIPKKEMGNIVIHFTIEKEILICTIEDNGIGFQNSKAQKENLVTAHKSMAIDITQKRLEMIKSTTKVDASLTIEELKNNEIVTGTKVTLRLPIQYVK